MILIPVHATLVSSLAFLSIAFCLWAKFPIVQAAFLLSEGFILVPCNAQCRFLHLHLSFFCSSS